MQQPQHDVVKQTTKPLRPLPAAAVLVDVETPPASLVTVLPADAPAPTAAAADDDKTPPPVAACVVLHAVFHWTVLHQIAFSIAILVAIATPCTKLTWLHPPCVALAHAAEAEVIALLFGETGCLIAVATVSLPLVMLLTGKIHVRGRWWVSSAADALAWVALAATAGLHSLRVAEDCIYLAADPGETYFFVRAVLVSGCLPVDVVLAGFLLCRRWLSLPPGAG